MRRSIALVPALVALGCGTSPPPPPPVDSSVPLDTSLVDSGPQDAFVGAGALVVRWTINGMPPSEGCAAVGANRVNIRFGFGSTETVPCTDLEFRRDMEAALQGTVTGRLLSPMDAEVFRYTALVVIPSGGTAEVTLPFAPPGALQVNWQLNGMPASAECMRIMGYGIRLSVGLGNPIQASFGMPMDIRCGSGRYTFNDLQSGTFSVEGELFNMGGRRQGSASTAAEVRSGATTRVTLDIPTEM